MWAQMVEATSPGVCTASSFSCDTGARRSLRITIVTAPGLPIRPTYSLFHKLTVGEAPKSTEELAPIRLEVYE